MDDRALELRRKLDNNKLPSDLYALDQKKLAQLQEKAAKLLEQNTQAWADINTAVEAAKERDRRYLETLAQAEELEASIPARALAAGVQPPQPELDTAVEALQRQVAKTTATEATCNGPLAEIMRAANETMQQLQAQLTAAQNLRQGTTHTDPMQVDRDRNTGANDGTNSDNTTPAAATATTTSTAPTTSTTTDANAEGPQLAPATATEGESTQDANMAAVEAEHASIQQRAREAAVTREDDPDSVATARSALRARLLQQPDDYEWLQRGTLLVVSELAKLRQQSTHTATATQRQRSRSRSGCSAGDNQDDL